MSGISGRTCFMVAHRLNNEISCGHRFVELFKEHLVSERNASPNTIASYLLDLQDVIQHIDFSNPVTEEMIYCYVEHLGSTGLSAASMRRKISALRQFLSFVNNEKLQKVDTGKFIQLPRKSRLLPKIVDRDVIDRLHKVLEDWDEMDRIRGHLILYLLYGSGLRVSELISLKYSNFIQGRFLKIMGKGQRERIIPVASIVDDILAKWSSIAPDSAWIFPSVNPQKHITRQRVFQILKDMAMAADIPLEKISPHVLRHAFATHILDNGADLFSVKKMLGHQQIATTEIYTHVTRKKLKKVILEHHPLNKQST